MMILGNQYTRRSSNVIPQQHYAYRCNANQHGGSLDTSDKHGDSGQPDDATLAVPAGPNSNANSLPHVVRQLHLRRKALANGRHSMPSTTVYPKQPPSPRASVNDLAAHELASDADAHTAARAAALWMRVRPASAPKDLGRTRDSQRPSLVTVRTESLVDDTLHEMDECTTVLDEQHSDETAPQEAPEQQRHAPDSHSHECSQPTCTADAVHDASDGGGVPIALKLCLLFVLYYGILSVYTLLGGLLMRALELPYELETRAASEKHTDKFLEFVRNRTHAFWNESDFHLFNEHLADYMKTFEHRIRCGYVTNDERWSLINSMFYVGTLFTTIGYGQIAPVTVGGRIVTVVISLIGIPLLMLNVAHLGVAISYFTRASISFFRRRLKLTSANDSESEDFQRYNMPLSVAFLIILIYILGMASVVAAAEEWPFIDAVYFTFITLATIGLGDLVPDHPLLLLVFSVFIIVGLTLVTIFIETFGLMMERRLVSCRIYASDVMAKASALFKRRHSFTKDNALRTTA